MARPVVGQVYHQFTAGSLVSVPAGGQARSVVGTNIIPFSLYAACKLEHAYLSITAHDTAKMTIAAAAVFIEALDGMGDSVLDTPLPLPGNWLGGALPESDLLRLASDASVWLSIADIYQVGGANPTAAQVHALGIVVMQNPDTVNPHSFQLNVGCTLRFSPYVDNDVLAGTTIHTLSRMLGRN